MMLQENTKLDDLSLVETMVLHKDYMTSFNCSNMYFHVRLNEDAVKYSGFSWTDSNGDPIYYQFFVMCYGYKKAVASGCRV